MARTPKEALEPAASIIARYGPTKLSSVCRVDRTQVWRWQISVERRGTGGRIPERHYNAILELSESEGHDLTIEDLIPLEVRHRCSSPNRTASNAA